MFPLKKYKWPDCPGMFGARRKFDIHTGVDLYCEEGSTVYAIEDGIVHSVVDFTGPKAGYPWWNDTQAATVKGSSGLICYGEITPTVKPGQTIKEADIIGFVKTVLKKDKGRPMSMLHIELYDGDIVEHVDWMLDEEQPEGLLDPTQLLVDEEWK